MRLTRMFRHACGPAAVAAAAVLCAASPAHADATVSPTTAYQGAGVNLTVAVTNESTTAAITAVRLLMPAASPVAEVYPLSVANWAPTLSYRTLNPPMPNPHGPDPIRQTTDAIRWTAIPGKAIPPGGRSEVMLTMGPLPESERITFSLEATYANGATGPALSPVTVTLAQPPPAPAPTDDALPPDVAAILAEDDQSDSPWTVVGWLAVLLAAGVGVALWWRSRQPADAGVDALPDGAPARAGRPGDAGPGDAGPGDAGPGDAGPGSNGPGSNGPGGGGPAGATAASGGNRPKVSAWSYRDRP